LKYLVSKISGTAGAWGIRKMIIIGSECEGLEGGCAHVVVFVADFSIATIRSRICKHQVVAVVEIHSERGKVMQMCN
jgi:hypothetical protein